MLLAVRKSQKKIRKSKQKKNEHFRLDFRNFCLDFQFAQLSTKPIESAQQVDTERKENHKLNCQKKNFHMASFRLSMYNIWDVKNIILTFSHNLEFMFLSHFSFFCELIFKLRYQ
jgi:hypothetical protein